MTDTAWLLWLRGLRGPEAQVLHDRGDGASPRLGELEKARKLAAPIRLKPHEARLPIAVLMRFYPLAAPS